jgi:hypothetical protein
MAGFQWVSGVLASTAFVGAAAASEPPVLPKEDPRYVCFMEQSQPTEQRDTDEHIASRREACLTQVQAVQLLKEGKTQAAMDMLGKLHKPSVPKP